jgi:hypothetical protein
VVIALVVILAVNGFLFYQRQSALSSNGGAPGHTQAFEEVETSTKQSEAEYLANVETIQNASVETLVSSNDKLLRYDTLNARDVEDLESNQSALAGYSNQVENLEAPQEHEDQYGAFSRGISELYEASNIAYLLAADPVSATQADFNSYNDYIDLATTLLQQSNENLGQHYKTTEGMQRPGKVL